MGNCFSGYVNVNRLETSGASGITAKQNNLEFKGVKASHTMAETDARRMAQYREKIQNVGCGIDPALIAGIISRESRAGNALRDGWGPNEAWGLMQLKPGHGNTPLGEWDSEEHLRQATRILVDLNKGMCQKFPNCSAEQKLKGAIAAYNVKLQGVRSLNKVDEYTTGGDYSNDVIARAQWYKNNEGF